ncbi:hypothetical protein FOZ62_000845 [Perkinsus olseni]|uniref:Uncharacterized protein n=1 Tax=Perkinsus olseni TaxID=32597 RepID=A0A7J6NNU7_PEROL|nr:hypothetical protein FOZ62_000845 [Perkinsus olseni]
MITRRRWCWCGTGMTAGWVTLIMLLLVPSSQYPSAAAAVMVGSTDTVGVSSTSTNVVVDNNGNSSSSEAPLGGGNFTTTPPTTTTTTTTLPPVNLYCPQGYCLDTKMHNNVTCINMLPAQMIDCWDNYCDSVENEYCMSWGIGSGRVCHSTTTMCQCTYLSVIQAQIIVGYIPAPSGWTEAKECDYAGTGYAPPTTTLTPEDGTSIGSDLSRPSYLIIASVIMLLYVLG